MIPHWLQLKYSPGAFVFVAIAAHHCIVCTSIEHTDDIEALANVFAPLAAGRLWKVSEQPFNNGSPNPCPCAYHNSRRHFLLWC